MRRHAPGGVADISSRAPLRVPRGRQGPRGDGWRRAEGGGTRLLFPHRDHDETGVDSFRPHLMVGPERSWARPQPEHGIVFTCTDSRAEHYGGICWDSQPDAAHRLWVGVGGCHVEEPTNCGRQLKSVVDRSIPGVGSATVSRAHEHDVASCVVTVGGMWLPTEYLLVTVQPTSGRRAVRAAGLGRNRLCLQPMRATGVMPAHLFVDGGRDRTGQGELCCRVVFRPPFSPLTQQSVRAGMESCTLRGLMFGRLLTASDQCV